MLLFTTFAGACMLGGGLLARVERIRPDWLEREFRHGVIAFGGGVLVASVALVLVPEGTRHVSSAWLAAGLLLSGGAGFLGLERYLGLHQKAAPQLTAMLTDYVPESLALGGMFALGAPAATALALLVGLQNLPEGFNAYRELTTAGRRPRRVLLVMAGLALLGPAVGAVGWLWGSPFGLSALMLFASGGILYLVFQDVAPQAHVERQWAPAFGAVLGFAFGLIGKMLVPAS